ncbi:SHOCT domain-containing protein [Actinotalea sp. K2]|uniref:SHOCT domain-containing protein n=1 Tax=Actinotalea sp. K2 TaxID=2939438 RepID=UPI0020180CAB|nr:SHOCT domain-containing protein [Actinotalea sp. K2]MCL3861909.1 SHOCT domain-containing protein [Actinotalea sp. K2]
MRRATGRGRRGPSLLGTAARTAVVAGTATAVSGRVAAARSPQPPTGPPPGPPPAMVADGPIGIDELHAQLTKLGELRSAGLLTDAEFEAQKVRLLTS